MSDNIYDAHYIVKEFKNLKTKLDLKNNTRLTNQTAGIMAVSFENLGTILNDEKWNTKFGQNIALCIADTLTDLSKCPEEEIDKQESLYRLLRLLVFHLDNDLHFWMRIYPQQKNMAFYRREQVADLRKLHKVLPQQMAQPFPFDVTIAVTAYNKLEYTKLAVESILCHTDFNKYRVELMLIDNGSTDGTSEYFLGVERATCFQLRHALGYPGTSLGAMAARGRYYIHFANDIVATPYWLENLLECIESDSDIGMVVPTCNYMSSGQSIVVQYKNPMEDTAELDAFARDYNHSNPARWEERIRLLPCMSIMPGPVARVAVNDSMFHFGEFADDDISCRLRRAGFRQIYAADTFVHHFGSVTAGSAQHQEQSLQVGRELFLKKWGVDAWSSLDFEWSFGEYITNELIMGDESILWVDPEFCALPVKIRSLCYRRGTVLGQCSAAVTNSRYLPDASAILEDVLCAPLSGCTLKFTEEQFSLVVFVQEIAGYTEEMGLHEIFEGLAGLLKQDGKICFFSKNKQRYGSLDSIYRNAAMPEYGEYRFAPICLEPAEVVEAAEKAGFSVQQIVWEKPLPDIVRIAMDTIPGAVGREQQPNRHFFVLQKII